MEASVKLTRALEIAGKGTKVALETNERAALKVANRFPLAPSQTPSLNRRPF
jgi:hypothetical protein